MSAGNPDQKVYVYAVFSSLSFALLQGGHLSSEDSQGGGQDSNATRSSLSGPFRAAWPSNPKIRLKCRSQTGSLLATRAKSELLDTCCSLRFFLRDTPSLKFLVDFGVWFLRWIFWWTFSGNLPWETKKEKIHRKIRQKIRDFQGNFLTKIHSGKFLP